MEYYHLFPKLLSSDYRGFIDDNRIEEEKELIKNTFNKSEWSKVMEYINHLNMLYDKKFQINRRSYKLANKIKDCTGIEVFPIIIRYYLGSMHNEEGYWTWYMLTINLDKIGSFISTREFLLKKHIIEFDNVDILGTDIEVYPVLK